MRTENPEPAKSETSTNAWHDENGTDIVGSAISGSSVVSDNSGTSERNSRRALILQMAKNRMKTHRESPVTPSPAIQEDEVDDPTVFTEAFDLTGDLD